MKNKYSAFAFSVLISLFGFGGSLVVYAAGPAIVNLGSSSNYVVLAKTAVTTTGITLVTGNIGISPAHSTDISGFSPILDGSGTFSTSALVTGKIYASDYTSPTPSDLTTAVSAMEAAYTDASTRTPGVGASNLNVGGGTLTGNNFVPGTYTWNTGNVSITGDITLTGSATDVWIFQITGTLDIQDGKKIILAGGAVPQNIFWAVAGTTTIKPGATFEGNILGGSGASTIAMQSGATLNGRALGQTDVTLIGSTISAGAVVTPPSLRLINTVTLDNGGTALATAWTLTATGTGGSPTNLSGSTPVNSGLGFGADTYTLSETGGPSGYTASTYSCIKNGGSAVVSNSITLISGDSAVCTINNNDNPAHIIVIDHVDNTGGGFYSASNFSTTISGVSTAIPTSVGFESPGVDNILTTVGSYSVDQVSSPVYNKSLSSGCSGTILLNQTVTCTITNTYIVPIPPVVVITHTNSGHPVLPPTVVVDPVQTNTGTVVTTTQPLPEIDILVIPSALVLPAGLNNITYDYMVWNVTGIPSLNNISVKDNKCSSVAYVSGDSNNNGRLDQFENWMFSCSTTIGDTTTNTASVTGIGDDGYAQTVTANDTAVVEVSSPGFPKTGVHSKAKGNKIKIFSL